MGESLSSVEEEKIKDYWIPEDYSGPMTAAVERLTLAQFSAAVAQNWEEMEVWGQALNADPVCFWIAVSSRSQPLSQARRVSIST